MNMMYREKMVEVMDEILATMPKADKEEIRKAFSKEADRLGYDEGYNVAFSTIYDERT